MKSTGFIWIDSGNGRSERSSTDVVFFPTVLYRRKIALKATEHRQPPIHPVSQTAQLLHTCYGRDMDPELARIDAFYAFHEIFEFCAFSEVQFLNFMEKQLEQYHTEKYAEHRRKSANGRHMSIGFLHRCMTTINKHISQIETTLDLVRSRGDPHWPRATHYTYTEKVEAAVRQLKVDFEHLLSRAKKIEENLSYSIFVSLLESNSAHMATAQTNYTKSVIALVLIAFLIFTTSFFSMNFRELQDLSVWIYFVASTVLTLPLAIMLIYRSKLRNLVSMSNSKGSGKDFPTPVDLESEKTKEQARSTRIPRLYRRRTTLPV